MWKIKEIFILRSLRKGSPRLAWVRFDSRLRLGWLASVGLASVGLASVGLASVGLASVLRYGSVGLASVHPQPGNKV